MSLPTLPTSEHDIVVPLPDQASIDSRLKHLRAQRKVQQKTPSGLVVDPVELLRCIGGSDSTFSVHNSTTYSHSAQAVTLISSPSINQDPVCSHPQFTIGGGYSSDEDSADESRRALEHFEVDPHARGVHVFRRNSLRQFSSLAEENENQETSSYPPPTGGPQTPFTTTPLFVISDGIRQTYFPGQPSRSKKQQEVEEETTDPVAMYEQISNQTFLRKHPSHPELSSLGEPFPKPFKVAASPDFNDSRRSISIFSSLAGELRSQVRATVPQHRADQSNVAFLDNKKVDQSEKQDLKIAQPFETSPQTSLGKVELDNFDISDIPDGKPKKKSMMKSLIKWGTESRVKVSDKETNMYSPGSF